MSYASLHTANKAHTTREYAEEAEYVTCDLCACLLASAHLSTFTAPTFQQREQDSSAAKRINFTE
jgi:hypothetical protein